VQHSPPGEADSGSPGQNCLPSVEPEGSLQCSQQPATGRYFDPAESMLNYALMSTQQNSPGLLSSLLCITVIFQIWTSTVCFTGTLSFYSLSGYLKIHLLLVTNKCTKITYYSNTVLIIHIKTG
jgi:hypothetical protein